MPMCQSAVPRGDMNDPFHNHRPPSFRPAPPQQQQAYPTPSRPPSIYPPPIPAQHYAQHPQAYQPQQPTPSFYPNPYAQPYVQHSIGFMAVPANVYQKGSTLVFYSRMTLLAAVVLSFGGCGAMIGGPEGGRPFFGIGLLVGVSLFIVAAIIGTIGRRMQGRVI